MTITAEIIQDSITTTDCRLTTFVVKYPRMVHAELMTHRVFSRNASSSRAIPVSQMIGWVKQDPAMPVEWGKNQGGMQAKEVLSPAEQVEAEMIWLEARDDAIRHTERLLKVSDKGVHKQIANRLLEPWHHIVVIITATQFANWFGLRYHVDAQPEIAALAAKMLQCYNRSQPVLRSFEPMSSGKDWHLPFISDIERAELPIDTLIKCSVARCARVSRLNHDGSNPVVAEDIKLHDRLVVSRPLHASPAEHQARVRGYWDTDPRLSGNFKHPWIQYRKTLPNECIDQVPSLLPKHQEA